MKIRIGSNQDLDGLFPLVEGRNLIGRTDTEEGICPEIDLDSFDAEAKVSRKHAIIEISGTEVSIQDLGSAHGTFINDGERLEPAKRYGLREGDSVKVGNIVLLVED